MPVIWEIIVLLSLQTLERTFPPHRDFTSIKTWWCVNVKDLPGGNKSVFSWLSECVSICMFAKDYGVEENVGLKNHAHDPLITKFFLLVAFLSPFSITDKQLKRAHDPNWQEIGLHKCGRVQARTTAVRLRSATAVRRRARYACQICFSLLPSTWACVGPTNEHIHRVLKGCLTSALLLDKRLHHVISRLLGAIDMNSCTNYIQWTITPTAACSPKYSVGCQGP